MQYWRHQDDLCHVILQSSSRNPSWYWHQRKHKDQCNRIEGTDRNEPAYIHLILGDNAKNIHRRIDSILPLVLEKVGVYM